MTERSLFPESVEVRQRDLAYTEETKSEQLRQRLLDTLGPARRDGLITTATGTLINVSAGRGYTPNGELAVLENNQNGISLSNYANNVNNFVYLTYREQETTPAAHETDGTSRNTRTEALIGISVLTAAEYAALPTTNSADLTSLAQDRMILIATVNANGVAVNLLPSDVTLAPIVTLATTAAVDVAIAVATEGRQRLGYIPDIDPPTPAAGDGVTNDAAALATAISLVPTGGVLDLGGKTYFIANPVDIARSDITIANGTILVTGLTGSDAAAFTITGSLSLPTASINVALPSQRTNIEFADLTGYAVGDIVYISDPSSYSTGVTLGELNRIRNISGTFLDLDRGLLGLYSGTGTLRKVTPRRNIIFDRINFVGSTPASPTDIRTAIQFNLCDRPTVRNCTFSNIYTYNILLIRSYDARVDACTFRDTSLGEGVRATDGCYNVRVSRCTGDNTRTLLRSAGSAAGGVNVSIHETDCEHSGSGALGYFEANTFDYSTRNSSTINSDNGVICFGDRAEVSGNRIQNVSASGIIFQPAKLVGDSNVGIFSNNNIEGTAGHGIVAVTASGGRNIESVVISGNRVARVAANQSAILVNSAVAATQIEGIAITGNSTYIGGFSTHINLVTTTAGAILLGAAVTGNVMLAGTGSGFRIAATAGSTIQDITAHNTGRAMSVGCQVENNGGIVERVNIDGDYEAGIGYDIVNNTGSNINSSIFSGTCRGIGDALLDTGVGVKITNDGVLDRVNFTGNFNGTSVGVSLSNQGNGVAGDVLIGGVIRGDKDGVRVVNVGVVGRLRIEGSIVGFLEEAIFVENNNNMFDLSIDAVAVGELYGCRVIHGGANTLNTLTIRGQYSSTGNDVNAAGIYVSSPTSASSFQDVFIDARATGNRWGGRLFSSGNLVRAHISGNYSGGTTGLELNCASAGTIQQLTVNASCFGGSTGLFATGSSSAGVTEASVNVVARGGDSGMRINTAFRGHVAGHFVGGTIACFSNVDPDCTVSLTGITTGGNYGVRSDSGAVLCVGVLSTGFAFGARLGAGIIYGDAAAGHCVP